MATPGGGGGGAVAGIPKRKKSKKSKLDPKDGSAAEDEEESDNDDFSKYRSRTAKIFDDSNSNDDGHVSSEEDPDVAAQSKIGVLKSTATYLKKQIE